MFEQQGCKGINYVNVVLKFCRIHTLYRQTHFKGIEMSEEEIFINKIKTEAISFSQKITNSDGKTTKNGSGNFPCKNFRESPCPSGCNDSIKRGAVYAGFPFQVHELIGEGGYARVYGGSFHQFDAAFKFIKVENNHEYSEDSRGCYEYCNQE